MSNGSLLRHGKPHQKVQVTEPRLEKSMQARFYVATLRFVDRSRMEELKSIHLTKLLEMEKSGALFLSGPANSPDGDLNGFLVLRADSLEDARAMVDAEPFIAQGVMECDVYEWSVFQGAIAVSVHLSDGTADFC